MPALNDATNKVRARQRSRKRLARAFAPSRSRARDGTRVDGRAMDGWMNGNDRPTARSPEVRDATTTTTTTTRDGDFERLTTRRASRANAGQSLVVEVHEAIEEKLGRVGGRGATAAVERTVDESEVGGFGGTVVQFDSGRV